ncbi:hypothetical protein [Chelativorans sp. AA-79]|uniref:hypothetical protein n=1 Tax=Chelativorans sp. AA-79 TaxID=3028735 RepID=UPI0023F78D2C|nr:hypothetical protein [Chelativorans sp. AA-79]WEX10806.1 hypothetical protein PVE73_07675 [Chelativorans sp. AA-79]
MSGRKAAVILLGGVLSVLAGSLLAQPDFGFMPDGGRQTLLRLARSSAIDLEEIARGTGTEDEWKATVAAADPDLSSDAVETLASYLAINMPAQIDTPAAAGFEELAAALPLDGKELAIENCQFCHSFFTGYLAHDRDTEGWRSVFKAPFHKELPMTEKERETFARYSAINMPIPYEKVPEDLRF